MKKVMAVILCIFLCFALVACTDEEENATKDYNGLDLWTYSGTYIGYTDDNYLWTYQGEVIGKLQENEVYNSSGKYVCEIRDDERLLVQNNKATNTITAFTAPAKRYARYNKYAKYSVSLPAGCSDFAI